MSKKKKRKTIITIIVIIVLCLYSCFEEDIDKIYNKAMGIQIKSYSIDEIPQYEGKNYIIINNNIPEFKEEDYSSSFENYSNLDKYGRSGVAFANVSKETMPTTKRQSIGLIKPSGWQISKYDFIDGKYLYNRCHLIGYQLTGENDNAKNLITCTRQMNTIGMLPFENKVATYIKQTGNHVLYRVSPIYQDKNLLASGVQMEAKSIEDNKISFNIFVYNVQDGIQIDYQNGENKLMD